ncbi:hypothetical protein [Kitasatospora sp. A2-31]|uniref:hypothetical protein n=1 Tax=Kitasatospora sp. A2-31 TaxID=2916414 RepID=UPI001EE7D186|nr:hypothetical protein [Kitasatospora sp. A2-31]MCG6493440.1 hypothetical protein [Kitasatospora sp. A2-31]
MTKSGGLGDNFYSGGYDLSGDIGSVDKVQGGHKPIEVTGINKLAPERIGGVRDASMSWKAFFNTAVGAAHPVLSALPTADVVATYCRGTTLGSPCASLVAKQINYDGNRSGSGEFVFSVDAEANSYGLEWGVLLTAGLRTDTAATNGASIDTTASAAFGAQAYLQVTAFTGTDVTIKIQDSADNVSFADVAGLTFTAVTAAPFTQRVATGNTATIRRYLRAVTTTSGGVTSVTFAVHVTKNDVAGVVF